MARPTNPVAGDTYITADGTQRVYTSYGAWESVGGETAGLTQGELNTALHEVYDRVYPMSLIFDRNGRNVLQDGKQVTSVGFPLDYLVARGIST